MKFSPDALLRELQTMPTCQGLLVGLSGGRDSMVLLHALLQLREQNQLPWQVRAIHIDHGLNPDAKRWCQQCEAQCATWNFPFTSRELHLGTALGQTAGTPVTGVENAARIGRYAVFTEVLGHDEALLLAHHRDDQMETVLLRLLRGAGPKGLAGMPRSRALGRSFLFRPLLNFDHRDLCDYAAHHALAWIDDESNKEQAFDRNYLRHTVLPLLETRWPGYRDSWSKSVALQAEADDLLQQLARSDLEQLRADEDNALQLDGILRLDPARQRNVLRHWLTALGFVEPGWNELQHLTGAILPAATDASAIWVGDQYSVCRFQNHLVVLRNLAPITTQATYEWNPLATAVFDLPGNGQLRARPALVGTADKKLAVTVTGVVQVRYRQGGENCRFRQRPGKSLKKLLQEQGVAPWIRARMPLIYADTELICVPGIGAAGSLDDSSDAHHLVIEWLPPNWNPAAN